MNIKKTSKSKSNIYDDFNYQIKILNKRFPQLEETVNKYFENDTNISFDSIKNAFLSGTDPIELVEKYKPFTEEYLYKVKKIRDENSLFQSIDESFLTNNENIIETKNITFIIENTLNNFGKLFLTSNKNELLHLINELQKESKEIKNKKRKLLEAKEMYKKLYLLSNDKNFIRLDSLKKDLELLNELIKSFKKRNNKIIKKLNIGLVVVLSIIILISGVGIWLIMK